jgi:hypothetical protein
MSSFESKAILLLVVIGLLLASCKGREAEQSKRKGSMTNSQGSLWSGPIQFGTSLDDEAAGIAVDLSGNIYIAGTTHGGLDGITNAGLTDIIVVKFNELGTLQWTRQLGTTNEDEATALTVDAGGNVYVTGSTLGGLGDHPNKGERDLFVIKYDPSGRQQWIRQLGTESDDEARSIAIDDGSNIYVAGFTFGGLDGNTSAGFSDLFVVKHDRLGTKLWVRQMGDETRDYADGVAVDASRNVYLAGLTYGQFEDNRNAGRTDILIVKYNAMGVKEWSRMLGTVDYEAALRIAVDSGQNVLVTGYTFGALDGQSHSGNSDIYILKFDALGARKWSRQVGTETTDRALGIAIDSKNNVYSSGLTLGSFDGHDNAGNYDALIVKFDPSGSKQWSRQFGTASMDRADGIAIDSSDNIFIVGTTNGSVDGTPNRGGSDLFIIKYGYGELQE